MAAYWLLPLWLLTEILYGSAFGQSSGVAHWAHVGGFAFGALIALAIQKSGLEQMAEKGIQEKISWVSHPLLAEASEQMEKGQLDPAAASLQKLLLEKPDSIDAYRMLQRIYWQKNDLPAHRDALAKLLGLEIKANDHEGALQTCQDFRNAGGEKLPASLWLEFCRQLETQPDVSRAADEYLGSGASVSRRKTGTARADGRGTHLSEAHESPRGCVAPVRSRAVFLDSARGLANHHRPRHRRSKKR